MFSASEVLGAMITPAVLISASALLVLSTSARLGRVVDRIRALADQAERLRDHLNTGEAEIRRRLIADQLTVASDRVLVLRSAMATLYASIGLLITTSIVVGIVAALDWSYGWIAVLLGLSGSGALLWGSFLLVREGRLAIGASLQEIAVARKAVGTGEDGDRRAALHPPSAG